MIYILKAIIFSIWNMISDAKKDGLDQNLLLFL